MDLGESQSGITLEVLNPRGALRSVPLSGLSNRRVTSLDGNKIALMSEKPEATHFFDALGELLKERYPTATILRFDSPTNPMRPDNTAEVAAACDVWLQGVKTSGSSEVDYDVKMERLGRPGASFCIDSLMSQRRRLAQVNGMPTLRIISVPALDYLGAEGYPEKMRPVAASVLDATILALTAPLTEQESNPPSLSYDFGPLQFAGDSHDEALERFQRYFVDNYLGDGLPLMPPTREAVARMLAGTSRSPDEELGLLAPRSGVATIEKVAINAVMAGARPEYLPVIVAAIECVAEPGFNLYHISTSTGCPTPIIWVNGPIAEEIGMNAGMGFLGRGNRANSTIGRAIGLCLINIGWRLMDADAGFVGDPEGYCSFTFPENEKASPWESFAVGCGFGPEQSTVTVNETMSYDRLGPGGGMSSQTWEESLEFLARNIRDSGGLMAKLQMGGGIRFQLALNPTLARKLTEAGFTKRSLAEWFQQHTQTPWERLSSAEQQVITRVAASGMVPGLRPEDCGPGLVFLAIADPEFLAILVAGDAAGHSVMWNSPVGSTSVAPDMADRVRGALPAFMTKVIRGATLTKAGR